MKRFLILLLSSMILGVWNISAADTNLSGVANAIYVAGASASPGETVTLSIMMKNESQYTTGYQFSLVLPEGVTYVNGSVAKSSVRGNTANYQIQVRGTRTLAISCYSPNGTFFRGYDGEVATLQVVAPNVGGDYTLTSKGGVIAEANGSEVDCIEVRTTLHVHSLSYTDLKNGTHRVSCPGGDINYTEAHTMSNGSCIYCGNTPVTSISLNYTSRSLTKGGTVTLKPTITPTTATDKTVKWSSSNTSVATVSTSGVVKAIASGKATITCTANDGSNAKATCVVTVTTPVSGITISSSSEQMKVGESLTLTASTNSDADNKGISWSSSNTSVATVSGGLVTAIAEGQVTIKASASSDATKYATCTITVGHTLVEHAAVTATCTTAGNTKYWTCSSCNKYFADANGQTEITATSTVIPALGHDTHCTSNNDGTHTTTCSRCDYSVSEDCNYVDGQCSECQYQQPSESEIDDTDISKYDNALYINNMVVAPGKIVTIPIQLKNNKPITGFQCDIALPTGMSFIYDDYGYAEADISEERILRKLMSFDTNTQPDGTLRLLANSTRLISFSGNDGEVATVALNISASLEDGNYPIWLKNIILTDASGAAFKIDDVKSSLTVVSYILGDANGDKEVNVADLSTIAAHILGYPLANFVFKGADANEDNEINVADLSRTAGIILGTFPPKSPKRDLETEATFDMNLQLKPLSDNSYMLHVGSNNTNILFSGFQFDLSLPKGLNFMTDDDGYAEVSLSMDRTNSQKTDHFDYCFMEDGSLRVLGASSHNAMFEGENGDIITLKIEADEDFDPQRVIALRNIIFTSVGESKIIADEEFNITNVISSIEKIDYSSILNVYDMNGRYVQQENDVQTHGMFIINGKKIIR